MPKQGPVLLTHINAHAMAGNVIRLCKVNRDITLCVPSEHGSNMRQWRAEMVTRVFIRHKVKTQALW